MDGRNAMDETTGRTIRSVERACEIISFLQRNDEANLTEIADSVDLTPGTVHTYLNTLKQQGYVMQEAKAYRLDPWLLTLGEQVRNNLDIYRAAKEEVDGVAFETGEVVHLIVEHDGECLAAYEAFGPKAIGKDIYIQNRGDTHQFIHCTAGGKAILAHLPDEEVERIVENHGLEPVTPNTITDFEELREELEQIRERGCAFNDREQMTVIRSVGAPILDADQRVRGAISVSGPPSRVQAERFREELPKIIMEAADTAQVNLHSLGV